MVAASDFQYCGFGEDIRQLLPLAVCVLPRGLAWEGGVAASSGPPPPGLFSQVFLCLHCKNVSLGQK